MARDHIKDLTDDAAKAYMLDIHLSTPTTALKDAKLAALTLHFDVQGISVHTPTGPRLGIVCDRTWQMYPRARSPCKVDL